MNEKPIYIIAEAAQGYQGSVDIAKLLIDGAASANANAIKFQVVYADDLATKDYVYYDLFKSLEMPKDSWCEIRNYARTKKIDFIIDIFGPLSLQMAQEIGPDGLKIHSTVFFDQLLIEKVFSFKLPVYMSIGGIEFKELEEWLHKYDSLIDKDTFTILYGYQAEPTPPEKNNLLRIPTLKKNLGVIEIGFMDHSDGDSQENIHLSVLALGLGVKVFEKHITLDRGLEMEDFISALSPSAFKEYTYAIHSLSAALGSNLFELTEEERIYRSKVFKHCVVKTSLKKGHVLQYTDILLKRSSQPQSIVRTENLVGKTLIVDMDQDQGITESLVR